jgi:outer membrane protein TolC
MNLKKNLMGRFKLITKLVFIISIFLFFSFCKAQDSISRADYDEVDKLLIPKLDVLVEAAWEKHGMVKFREADIEARESELISKKRYWTRNFGVQGDYRYGTFANFSENVTDASSVNLSSNTTQVNYGIGFYLKLPVFDLYNRKNSMKQAEAEIEAAESFLEFQKFEVKESVINHYEELIMRQNLLEVSAKNLANAKLSYNIAEKEYKDGLLPIHEFVRLTDITARIESEYLRSKSQFLRAKKLLENLTGLSFN